MKQQRGQVHLNSLNSPKDCMTGSDASYHTIKLLNANYTLRSSSMQESIQILALYSTCRVPATLHVFQ